MSRQSTHPRSGADRTNLYDDITGKIIAELETGRIPWVQPWGTAAAKAPLAMPQNASTRRRYSGINVLILWGAVIEHGFAGQSWLTFRQALSLGGNVCKGERGTTVVYADRFIPDDEKKRARENGDEAQAIPFLKRFTVFNTDQCENLPEDIAAVAPPPPPGMIEPQAEALIAATGADFRSGGGRAYYVPALDYVQVPPPAAYFEPINWHRTTFHELGHWTGHLASRRSAALPVAAALGGMIVPTALYLLIVGGGPWSHGWGVPMATDTAFAVALIVMMGRRVPVELRIFLTAAAIIDDIGAILVVAVFYSGELHGGYLAAALATTGVLAMLNRSHVYRVTPYMLTGVALWFFVYAGGLHATLAGVVLALFIPTRPPPDLRTLMMQANTIIAAEARRAGEVLHHGPSGPALQALDAIHDRLESTADRLLRYAGARSSYLVLPLFALTNAGVVLTANVFAGHEPLVLAIVAGLVIGKPLGLVAACALAVRFRVAVKPDSYSWRQLAGAGALAGIGFTMSLFIAGEAFPTPETFAAAKIAIFIASVLSAVVGVAVLWTAKTAASQSQHS